MNIEIVEKDGTLISDFELEANPFKVGEKINITVTNHDSKFWVIKDHTCEYIIEKIEHFVIHKYLPKENFINTFTVSVTVTPA